jgi:hypothetical protein
MRSIEERVWSRVDKHGPVFRDRGPCWIWLGKQQTKGYGQIKYAGEGRLVHRLTYEWAHGPIPPGLMPDHLCRHRPCVNPDHMEAVTCRVNLLRGDTVNARHASATHCPMGHPYEGANLYVSPSGKRACVACRPRWKPPRTTA